MRVRYFSVALALTVLAAAQPIFAASEWDAGAGTGNRDWSAAANWSADTEPTSADAAYINGGFTGVVSQAGERALVLYVGSTNMPSNGANRTGRVEQAGGDLAVGSASIGKYAGSAGSYFITNGSLVVSNTLLVGDQGLGVMTITNSGSVSVYGNLAVGNAGPGSETPGSSLTLGDGTLSVSLQLQIGGNQGADASADGLYVQYGGTANISQTIKVGDNPDSTGRVFVAGGTLTAGLNLVLADSAGARGTMNVSGDSTVRVVGVTYVSDTAAGIGRLTVSGGYFNAEGNLSVAESVTSTGFVAVTGGRLVGGDFTFGTQGNAALNVSGGSVTARTLTASYAPNGLGTLSVSGGRLVVTNDGQNLVLRRPGAIMNVSGGAVEANGVYVGTIAAHNFAPGPAALNISGGTVLGGRDDGSAVSNDFYIGTSASVTGLVSIGGGLLDLSRANNDMVIGRGTGSLGILTLGGGTAVVAGVVRIGASSTDDEPGGNGQIFVTNGLLSVGGNLVVPSVSGSTGDVSQVGGIVKADSNVRLGSAAGVGRYIISGGTLTSAGTLQIGNGTTGSGRFEVAGGASTIVVGNMTMQSLGELRSRFAGSALSPIQVAGTITAAGTLSITNTGAYSSGSYLVATSLSGTAISGTFAATNWLNGVTGTVSYANNRILVTFAVPAAGISGQVRYDSDGDGDLNDADTGIERVSVILYSDPNADGDPTDGTALSTNLTSSTGSFSFSSLSAGSYVLVETDRAGYRSTADSQGANDNRVAVNLSGTALTNNVFLDEYELLTKSVNKTNASAGEVLTYTLTPFYAGNNSLVNIQVSDAIPTGTAYVVASANASGTFTNGVVSWSFGSTAAATPGTTSSNGVTTTTATGDTYVRQDSTAANFGTAITMEITSDSGKNRSDLIRFDLSSIPAGAIVNSAWLRMSVDTAGGGRTADIRHLTTSGWTETGATWNTRDGSASWAGGGGFSASDYATNIYGTFDLSSTGLKSNSVTAIVANWVSGAVTNNGFAIIASGATGNSKFDTREDASSNNWPTLIVSWVKPGASNSVDIIPNMIGGTAEVKVVMSVWSAVPLTNVTPTLSATNVTGGVTATLISGPTPSSSDVYTNAVSFTYYYTAQSGTSTGTLSFVGGATATTGTIPTATSDRIFVNAPLTFQVTVSNAPVANIVTNRARWTNSGGLPTANSLAVTTYLFGAISGQVREDADGDGSLADPDSGITNVTVTLWTDPNADGDPADGTATATNRTDASGNYAFSMVASGSYVVVETDIAGYTSTADSQGANDNRIAVTIVGVQGSTNNVFLDMRRVAISGQVREDIDGDGDLGDADSGLAGATVILYTDPNGDGNPADGSAIATNNTDGTGSYSFPSNSPGTYVIQETDPAGHYSTADSVGGNDNRIALTLVSGVASTNNVFLDATYADISGHVRNDTDGLGNLAGAYSGITNVTVVLWTDPNADGNPADGTATSTNFTDASGAFDFPSLMPGYYVLVETDPAGFLSTADSVGTNDNRIALLLASGSVSNGLVFLDTRRANISGSVRHDTDGDGDLADADSGITNVTITLWTDPNADGDPADGVALATNVTDASGAYIFTNNVTGTYVVVETDPAGFVSTADSQGANDNRIALTLASGTHSVSNRFLDTRLVAVSGQVRHDTDGDGSLLDADSGLASVTITLWTDPNADGNPADGAAISNVVTDVGGNYAFTNFLAGSYVVVETDPAGYQSTADSQGANDNRIALTLASGAVSTNNVFLDSLPASISGQVRRDLDSDGDVGDPDLGVTGVTITLWTDPNGDGNPSDGTGVRTNVTDSSGNYAFTNVLAGTYVVVETDKPGYNSTADTQGANDNRIAVTLTAGVDSTGNNFLDALPIVVGAQVRLDTDGDGDLNDADSGIFRVTVTLYTDPNSDGDPADGASITNGLTDSSGFIRFNFGGIADASYVLVETDPAGYRSTADSQGANDNRVAFTLASASSTNHVFLDEYRYLTKSVDRSSASVGDTLTYTVTPYYAGNTALTNVQITDAIPTGAAYVVASANAGGTYTNRVVTWALGSTAAGTPGITVSNGTTVVNTMADTYVRQDSATANFGAATTLECGPDATKVRSTLLRFDLSAIPAGATVNAAWLKVVVQTAGGGRTAEIRRMTNDWTEGGSTWNTKNGTDAWNGGSFSSADYGTNTFGTVDFGSTGATSNNVTTAVAGWVLGSVSNRGFVLIANGAAGNAKIYSKEDVSSANWPELYVDWTLNGTSNTIDIIPNLIGGTGEVRVVMSLYSPTLLTNVTPRLVTTNITGSVTATRVSGPSPSSSAVHTNPVSFTYIYTIASGTTTGSISFVGGATATSGTFANATSDRILVSPPLTFQVTVTNPPGVSLISNRANFVNSGSLPNTNSLGVTTRVYSVISGAAREDADGDGNFSDPDSGLTNVTITLWTDPNGDGDPADGASIAVTNTAASGSYSFNTLLTGTYVVVETDPAGYFSTADSQGANDNRVAVNLAYVQHSQSNSFLDARRALIAGQVREDIDGDGDFNDADSGISGVTVVLYTDPNGDGNPVDGSAVATNVTDGSGAYAFASNAPGIYVIQETDPSGYLSSADSQGANDNRIALALVSGIDTTNNIFLDLRVAAVSGYVRDDTDASGNLGGAYSGITNVSVVLWTDPNADGNPADGAAILTNRTDASGQFSFPSNMPGYYVIVETDASGFRSTADSVGANDNRIPILLASGSTSNGLIFLDTRLANISGWVRDDIDGDGDFSDAESGITNVTIVLYSDPNADGNPADGVALATNLTDATGAYIFTNRTTGSYVVVETDPFGFVSSADKVAPNDNRIPVTLPGGQHSVSNIFLDAQPSWIRGQVRNDTDADGNFSDLDLGFQNVSIRLFTDPNGDGNPADGTLSATNITDASGYFVLTNVLPGLYVIVETDLSGTASTADSQGSNDNRIAITLLGGVPSTNNVFLDTVLVNISGQVRHDTDGDGDFGDADSGISNVTVRLYTDPNGDGNPADGTVVSTNTTTSSGNYSFTGIRAGTYVVVETDPSGFISTADTQGANDNQIAVSVSGTVDSTGNNFLDTQPVSISGQVRYDADSDSDYTDADSGLAGATVHLYTDPDRNGDPSDGTIVGTNVTTSTGNFNFTNLSAGAYVIVETDPSGYSSTYDSVGFNDNRIARILTSGQASTNNIFLDGRSYDVDLPGVTSNLETIVAGSWIIAMDTNRQNLAGAPFNLKAYGLVASLLHSNVPVKWVIRAGKAHNEKDFTAYTRRLYPSSASATSGDFYAGPFIIPKIFTNKAAAVISAYGNSVAVYELLSNTVMDVRYTLNTRPVVAALNDGGTVAIHIDALDAAGFVANVSYYQRYAYNTNPISTNSCYSFASEPHFEVANPSPQVASIRAFLNGRGNFLAQCIGVMSYENETNNGHFHTSHGIEERDDVSTYTYPDADMPFGQFQGDISDTGGSLHEWGKSNGTSWVNSAYPLLVGVENTNTVRATHGKMVRGRSGGNIFYLGGHNYNAATTLESINGRRMYMNAVFVPSLRPIDCGLTFGSDIGVTKTDGATYAPAGSTNVYTIVVTNNGPDDVINIYVQDYMPANFTNVAWSAVGTGGAVVPNANGSGNITELIDLPYRGTVTFSVTGLVLGGSSCLISNAVIISVPENVVDVVSSNDSAYDVSITHVVKIGGHVRDDQDADGDLLDSHPGLSNVTVRLYTDPNGDGNPSDGAILGTQSTAADGSFLFSNITTGRYIIEETDLSGYQSVNDSDGTNDNLIVIDVLCGITGDSTNNLFLDTRLATVSGQVRNDTDADGNTLDADAGLAGATVVLYTDPNGDGNPADGIALATNITGASGNFSFTAIDTGRYVIVETDPAGYASTADSQGANDNRIAISMPGGVNSTGHVFLDTSPSDIGGTVRHDLDGDANASDPDAGIAGVTVTLYSDPNGDGNPADGSALTSVLTDGSGRFLFPDTIPAYYVIVETDPAGYVSVADTQGANDNQIALLLVGGIDQTNHIFFDAITADISGQVREDTDGDGDLADIDAGISNVVIRLFTDPNCDGSSADGVAVATNITDASGYYTFTNIVPRCYVVVETDPAGLQSTADTDGGNANEIGIALISNSDTNGNDFLDTRTASISGWVLEDQDGDADLTDIDPGISGATLVLYSDPNGDGNPADGVALATNITGVSGSYVFGFLNPGSYVVIETDVIGYYSTADRDGTNDNTIAMYLPGGVNSTNNNFLDARTANISGQVRNDTDGDGDLTDIDPPLTNVTIRLFTDPNRDGNPGDGTAILTNLTDSSGNYLFSSVQPGYYVIVETDPAGYQSTADRDGSNFNWIVLGPHRSGVATNGNDFLDSTRGAIRGQVRNDIDGDGDFNDPDVGIFRAVVTLFTDPNGDGDTADGVAIATNLTDSSGYYAFTALTTGSYVVVETDPDGYHSTADTDGANDNRIRATLPGGVDSTGNNYLDDPDRVFKSVSQSLAYAGDTLTYSINTFYAGNQMLTNVVLTDRVPSGTVYVAGSANAGGTYTNGVVTWSLGSTAAGVPGGTSSSSNGFISSGGDTYIDDGVPTSNFGAINRLNVNPGTGKGNTVRNSLITFDLSGIPAGATINSAWLRTEVRTAGPDVNIFKATTAWTEGGATWNTRNGSASWAGGGAFSTSDYNTNILATISAGSTGVKSNNVLSAVQSWVQGTDTNRGFALVSAGNISGNAEFYSNEEGTASRRPVLYVNWVLQSTSNRLDLIPSLIAATSSVQVVMTLWSPTLLSNVTPNASLTTNATGGVTATLLSGPTPASATVHTNPVSFAYVYQVVAGSGMGTLAFSGGATASNGTFTTATSDRIIVAPLLRFNARVDAVPSVPVVTNVASLFETNYIPATNSNPVITVLRSAIRGQVREDLDGDANFSDADPGLTNVTVTLYTDPNGDGDPSDGAAVSNTVTDSTGVYLFPFISTGRYVVVESDPAGAVSTADSQGANDNRIAINLPVLSISTNNVFLDSYPVTVSGQVRDDIDADGSFADPDVGVSNVTIRLFTDPNGDGNPADGVAIKTNVTDGAGNYSFSTVTAGLYVVVQDNPPGYHTTADRDGGVLGRITLSLTSRVNSVTNNFLISQLAAIYGSVREDLDGDADINEADPGLTNVTVVLYSDPNGDGDPSDGIALATNLTDAVGDFFFGAISTGDYVLVETDLDGFISSADSDAPNDNRIGINMPGSLNSVSNIFLDYVVADITGQVREDTDGDGDFNDADGALSGATVALYTDPNADGNPADGALLDSIVTDVTGLFAFTNLTPGYYVVVETDPAAYASTADSVDPNDNRIPRLLISRQPSTTNTFLDALYAGIGITKTPNPVGDVSPGEIITYTITVTNAGVVPHPGVDVIDALPAELTYVSNSTRVVVDTQTLRDEFNTDTYTNSDGSISWTTDWTESGEADGPAAGKLKATGGELYISDKDRTMSRSFSLAGFTEAELTFDYRIESFDDVNDYMYLYVSSNGGSSFTLLKQWIGPIALETGSLNYDLGPYISSNMMLRFATPSTTKGDDIGYFDNFNIDAATALVGGSTPNLIADYVIGAGRSIVITFDATAEASQSIVNEACVTTTYETSPFCAYASNEIIQLLLTQGMVTVVSTNEAWHLEWSATGDPITRDYDLIYVDTLTPGFSTELTNEWDLAARVRDREYEDLGSTNHPPAWGMGEYIRFYRAAHKDRWLTNQAIRNASRQIYAAKAIQLVEGENWVSLFMEPDHCCASMVFGTNLLPAGPSMAESTVVEWYGSTRTGQATNRIWLDSISRTWQRSEGGSADQMPLPLNEGFNIILPPGSGAHPLPVIGQMPTNISQSLGTVQTLKGGHYNVSSYNLPYRAKIGQSGLREAGLRGPNPGQSLNPNNSDEIRILQRGGGSLASPVVRILMNANSNFVYWTGGVGSAEDYRFNVDDAVIIFLRKTTNNLNWTVPLPYPEPTPEMTP